MATILTKRSNTASSVPVAGDLTNSTGGAELAVNTADKRLFTKDSGGTVVELGTNPSSVTLPNGTANGVPYLNGSKVLTTGSALTFDGANLAVGQASVTAGSMVQVNGALLASNVVTTRDTTNLGVQIGGGGTVAAGGASTVAGIYADINGFGGASDLIIRPRSDGSAGALRIYTGSGGGSERYKIQSDGQAVWTIGSEQMRLTSTGLGIGTSSPAVKLQVQSGTVLVETTAANSKAQILLGSAGLNYGQIQNDSTGVWSLGYGAGYSSLGTPVLTWNASGNVGIGTSSPAFKLDVAGTVNVVNGSNGRINIGATNNYLYGDSVGNFIIGTSGGDRLTLNASGNLGLGVTPSAWGSGYKAFQQFSSVGGFLASGNYAVALGQNTYQNTSGQWIYQGASYAPTRFEQFNGAFTWYTAPSGTAGNAISFTQAMTLNASGNLGVGTSSPDAELEVKKTTNNTKLQVTSSYEAALWLVNGGGSEVSVINAGGSNVLSLRTNNTERARIDSSGALLVGCTSNYYLVADSGIQLQPNGSARFGTDGTSALNVISFVNGTNGTPAEVGVIQTSGSSTTYATSSDYRLKENIQPMTGALAKVQSLKPCTYTWKRDGSDGEGFIAHELAEVVPQCVTGEKDAVDADGNPVYQGIDTSFLVATLTAAIQELKAEFDAYKATHP